MLAQYFQYCSSLLCSGVVSSVCYSVAAIASESAEAKHVLWEQHKRVSNSQQEVVSTSCQLLFQSRRKY